jgi:hypothetical protein
MWHLETGNATTLRFHWIVGEYLSVLYKDKPANFGSVDWARYQQFSESVVFLDEISALTPVHAGDAGAPVASAPPVAGAHSTIGAANATSPDVTVPSVGPIAKLMVVASPVVASTAVTVPSSVAIAVPSVVTETAVTPSFLMDAVNGDARYCVIDLTGGDDVNILEMMKQAFDNAQERPNTFRSVSTTKQTLKQYSLEYPGFPVHQLANRDGFLFADCPKSLISELQERLCSLVKESLIRIGYCSTEQEVILWLSFLYTERYEVQAPHIDYKWEDIT